MASSPRINTQLGARQTLELRRKARLPVHRPSACSGDLIAGDGTKNGLSRSEQKTLSTTQNNRLTGKAPYKSTANVTSCPNLRPWRPLPRGREHQALFVRLGSRRSEPGGRTSENRSCEQPPRSALRLPKYKGRVLVSLR